MATERFMKPAYAFAVALLCAVSMAQQAAAQGRISAGQTVSGRLDASDYLRDDGTYYDDWFYEGRAGERLTVTQASSDFDSWLLLGSVTNGEFALAEFDDDGAGGNDSRITYTLPADGRYVIRVNVVGRGRTGSYTLRVERVGGGGSSSAGVRTLAAGQTFSGELDPSDVRWQDNTYYELWRYYGQAGERITITMRSPAFNSYLQYGRMNGGEFNYLGGSSSRTIGGQHEAVIEVTLPSSGEYGIRANSHGVHTGQYVISVSSAGGAGTPSRSYGAGSIGINQSVTGNLSSSDPALSDGTYYDIWRFSGQAGQKVRITLRSSDFDAYLAFGSMSGTTFESVQSDDDSGGGTDAMIEITLTASGEYAIRANSLAQATGSYTLSVQTR